MHKNKQKNKTKNKNRNTKSWEAILLHGVNAKVSTDFSMISAFVISAKVTKQSIEGNLPFCSVSVFSHLPTFPEVSTASSSYDKKR